MLAVQVETILEPPAEAKQRKRQACEAEIAGYMRDRADNVARMRDYVEQHNLRNVDPLGARFVASTLHARARRHWRLCRELGSCCTQEGCLHVVYAAKYAI